jgi:hypothetical protein
MKSSLLRSLGRFLLDIARVIIEIVALAIILTISVECYLSIFPGHYIFVACIAIFITFCAWILYVVLSASFAEAFRIIYKRRHSGTDSQQQDYTSDLGFKRHVNSRSELVQALIEAGFSPDNIQRRIKGVPRFFSGAVEMSVKCGPDISGFSLEIHGTSPNSSRSFIIGYLLWFIRLFGKKAKKEPETSAPKLVFPTADTLILNGKRKSFWMRAEERKRDILAFFRGCVHPSLPEVIIYFGKGEDAPGPIALGEGYPLPEGVTHERLMDILHYLRSTFSLEFIIGDIVVIHLPASPGVNEMVFKELTGDCCKDSPCDDVCPCFIERVKMFLKSGFTGSEYSGISPFFILIGNMVIAVGNEEGPAQNVGLNNMIFSAVTDAAERAGKLRDSNHNPVKVVKFGPLNFRAQIHYDIRKALCPDFCPGCIDIEHWVKQHEDDDPVEFLRALDLKVPPWYDEKKPEAGAESKEPSEEEAQEAEKPSEPPVEKT